MLKMPPVWIDANPRPRDCSAHADRGLAQPTTSNEGTYNVAPCQSQIDQFGFNNARLAAHF